MKKINKILMLLTLLIVILAGNVFAGATANENEYILTKEYTYINTKKTKLTNGFVEILIGSGDFVQYQDDEYITISPTPDEIKTDIYGNQYAYFDLSNLAPGAKFNVTVKRKFVVEAYTKLIPSRTNSEYLNGFDKYLATQEKIEKNDAEIISKAKELTEKAVSDYKKAEAIFEYVNVNMKYDESTTVANKGSVSALKNLRGVCEDFTTLFVAMCRAVNIPSRAIEGYRIDTQEIDYSGEKIKENILTDHVWAEIYLQDFGWVPVEPTVIYTVGSERKAYTDAFCKMKTPDYIANGIYYYENASRTMLEGIEEIVFNEKLVEVSKEVVKEKNEFTDLQNTLWAKDSVDFLYNIGVVNGYSETEFAPQNNISRIEFISMLARALRYKDTPYETGGMVYYYMDYNQDHWSKEDYDYLMRCYQMINPSHKANIGFDTIVEIFDNGSLDMNKPITRAEVVALMDAFLPEDNTVPKLTDIWRNKFQKSIVKAYNYGLIIGYEDKTFRPNNAITRAEIAVILERYIGNEIYDVI